MGRVLLFEETERYILRRRLIQFLREDRRYQNIVSQELRPLWKFTDVKDDAVLPATWHQVLDAYWRHYDGRINTYVEMIRYYVGRFGFFDGTDRDGAPRPADWVAEYVHANASESPRLGGPLDPGSGAVYGTETLDLTVHVSPGGATFRSFAQGLSRDAPVQEKWEKGIGPDVVFSFEDWDAVRAQLYRIVDEWVDAAARRFQEVYPHRNAASLQRWIDSVAPLFRHLYHGAALPDRAEREQLRRLAALLPLNFPAQKQRR